MTRRSLGNLYQLGNAIGRKRMLQLGVGEVLFKTFPIYRERIQQIVTQVRLPTCSMPIHVRIGTSDRVVLKQVFVDQQYAPLIHIPRVNTIVDCGANIGLTSMYLLECYPNAHLLAIEADTRNSDICRRNLRPYGDRASVITAGIWSRGDWDSTVPLLLDHTFGDGREWATTVKEAPSSVTPNIPGIGLRAVCDRVSDIDLLKVDIEGCEAVLFGADYDAWLPRVRNIAIELHGSKCSDIFSAALNGYTFDLTHYGELTFVMNLHRSVPK